MEHQTCAHESITPDDPSRAVIVKTSQAARTAMVWAFASTACFLGSVLLAPRPPLWGCCMISVFAGFAASVVALVLGLIALARMGVSGGRLIGRGFAVVAVTISSIELLVLLLLVVLVGSRIRTLDRRMECGTNLSGIGKAMLFYANDYEGRLPLAGGQGTTWGARLTDWSAASRAEAFGLDPNNAGGQATISSSLYLLVRYADHSPNVFVCPSDRGTRRFDPNKHLAARTDLTMLWDFGPDPVKHCSYAYQMVYGPHKLTTPASPAWPSPPTATRGWTHRSLKPRTSFASSLISPRSMAPRSRVSTATPSAMTRTART